MPKKILVVDDDDDMRELLRVILQTGGYEVLTACGGRGAFQYALLNRPDLIILDVMMPNVDGFEVLRILKDHEATSAIPVVMLTAKDGVEDIARGWEWGADLYLNKPFSPTDLIALIGRILTEE